MPKTMIILGQTFVSSLVSVASKVKWEDLGRSVTAVSHKEALKRP